MVSKFNWQEWFDSKGEVDADIQELASGWHTSPFGVYHPKYIKYDGRPLADKMEFDKKIPFELNKYGIKFCDAAFGCDKAKMKIYHDKIRDWKDKI